MKYQLWNLNTGNAVAECEYEAQVLALVRRAMGEHDRSRALNWALVAVADDDEMITVAEGDGLIDRARRAVAA